MTDTIFQPGEYVTRDGRKARVYATDGSSPYPIHGAIFHCDVWMACSWQLNGRHTLTDHENNCDLMPPKQVRYLHIRSNTDYVGWMHKTAEAAIERDKKATDIIARFRIEFTEGQYDD